MLNSKACMSSLFPLSCSFEQDSIGPQLGSVLGPSRTLLNRHPSNIPHRRGKNSSRGLFLLVQSVLSGTGSWFLRGKSFRELLISGNMLGGPGPQLPPRPGQEVEQNNDEPPPKPPKKPTKPMMFKAPAVVHNSGSAPITATPVTSQPSIAEKQIQKLDQQQEKALTPPRRQASPHIGFSLFAHNLGFAAGISNVVLGIVALLWAKEINERPAAGEILFAEPWVGPYCILAGFLGFTWDFYFGLKQVEFLPGEFANEGRSIFRVIIPLALGLPCFFSVPTIISGAALLLAAGAHFRAYQTNEVLTDKNVAYESYLLCKKKEKAKIYDDAPSNTAARDSCCDSILLWWKRQEEIGTLGQVILVAVFVGVNLILWIQRLVEWEKLVDDAQEICGDTNEYDCVSDYAPLAKAFGQTLNFNCAILLLPILRTFIRKLNSVQANGSIFAKYVPPLRKNIIFHKFIAIFILIGSLGHIFFHVINFMKSPEGTTASFKAGAFVTGYLITIAMFIIYSGAQNRVKRAQYEIFWNAHHSFLLFFGCLLAHGPKFWAWGCIPLFAYVAERLYRAHKSRKVFYVASVVYKKPVMCLSFFPARSKDFVFKEGQYLHLLAPTISPGEWHPFTISSAYEDLEKKDGAVTLHIRVQREGSWTWQLCQKFATMAPSSCKKGENFSLTLSHLDNQGHNQRGKHLGPDGMPIIQVDGPHAAPAQHYSEYDEVMLVGAGIGLTPSSAILQSILRHKWKKGFRPGTINFYFVLRHSEVLPFRWFIQLLFELQKAVASDYASGNLDAHRNRLQCHFFVTRPPKDGKHVERQPSVKMPRSLGASETAASEGPTTLRAGMDVNLGFDAADLELALLNPTVSSKQMPSLVADPENGPNSPNKFGNIWIWNGRPNWDEIFRFVKDNRQPSTNSIGVCFCGTPIIGKDLKTYCHKYSSLNDCRFSLHKENF